ncbi:MAG: 3-phosphoshikimate 1-carboxyvinyltransferase [Candidatus Omnitrophica bacterium]|nr:3-phosphoshikimate 1-carboxyvinyltransferase [Candidatus Omnitrophota bacterium]
MPKIPSFTKITGKIILPGDKSISHRAIMFSSITKGSTRILNFLHSQDTLATLQAFRKLGVKISYDRKKKKVLVRGKGKFLKSRGKILDMKESGTTIRIISGLLAAQRFKTTLKASFGLSRRPMKRITLPLRLMGADIKGRSKGDNEYPPLEIRPVTMLKAINYKLPVASAQVKSSLFLAGLYAEGKTIIREPYKSRDHTERMLKIFKADIKMKAKSTVVKDSELASPGEIFIPSDFSSASYFIALGLLSKNSRFLLKKVGINPTRTGFLRVLKRMGAKIRFTNIKKSYFEPYADILVEASPLKAAIVKEGQIPLMIDEVPLLFAVAAFAEGTTRIYGLKELKVKETDRIRSMEHNLRKAGVDFKVSRYRNHQGQRDFMVTIKGPAKFKSAEIKSFQDHRTAMSLIIANLSQGFEARIDNISCISKSLPEFLSILRHLA